MDLQQVRLIDEIVWRSRPPVRRIWTEGDDYRLSKYMEARTESFYRRLAPAPGSKLLDVACGSGLLTLMAARNGVKTMGVDVAGNLIERARERAKVEGLKARFEEADAEKLPFASASFDVVVSLVGAMFAPHPEVVASEFLRVCRPGGVIAMANWTAEGFVGQLFKTVFRYAAPFGMPDPVLWGDEATVRARFGACVSSLKLTRQNAVLHFPFPSSEVVHFFRRYNGPVYRAFASLNPPRRVSLQAEIEELWSAHNKAKGGFTKVDAEWLEITAIRAETN